MSDATVSIHHPTDDSVQIPYISSRGPLHNILMPEWQVRAIEDLGTFIVVRHGSESCDPAKVQPIVEIQPPPKPVEEVKPTEIVAAETQPSPKPVEEAAVQRADAPTKKKAAGGKKKEAAAPQADASAPPQTAKVETEAPESASAEDIAAIRAEVEALASDEEAVSAAAGLGVELKNGESTLEEIKPLLIRLLDEALAAE